MQPQAPSSSLNFIIYDPSASWPLVDSARLKNGEFYGAYSEQKLSTMQQARPACRVATYGWAEVQMNERAKTQLEEITEAQFEDALNVLPPAAWVRREWCESFHCCEMYTGNVSEIYVRVVHRCFKFRDVVSLTHDERVARATAFLNQ